MDVVRDHPDNVVQKLTRHRFDGELWFKVRWLGFTAARDTWQTATVLAQSCPDKIMHYYRRPKTRRTPELIEFFRETFPAADPNARLFQQTPRRRDMPARPSKRTRRPTNARTTVANNVITQPEVGAATPKRRGRPRKTAAMSAKPAVRVAKTKPEHQQRDKPPGKQLGRPTRGDSNRRHSTRTQKRGRGRPTMAASLSAKGRGRNGRKRGIHKRPVRTLHTKIGPRGEKVTLASWKAQQQARADRANRRAAERAASLRREHLRTTRELAAAASATAAAANAAPRYALRSTTAATPGPTTRSYTALQQRKGHAPRTRSSTAHTPRTSSWRMPDAW